MAVSMLSLGSGLFSAWLASIYNQTNWLLAKALFVTVHAFASLPGSFFYVRLPDPPSPLVEVVVFDFGAGAPRGLARRAETGSSTADLLTATTRSCFRFCARAGCAPSTGFCSHTGMQGTSGPRQSSCGPALQGTLSIRRSTIARQTEADSTASSSDSASPSPLTVPETGSPSDPRRVFTFSIRLEMSSAGLPTIRVWWCSSVRAQPGSFLCRTQAFTLRRGW